MASRFQFPQLQIPTNAITIGLSTIGAVWASFRAYEALSFIYLHFIRSSSLSRYKKTSSGKPAWAIVTGATDGIGKALALELAKRGFNIVLHGRNEKKLDAVKAELQSQRPNTQFRTIIIDAGKDAGNTAKLQAVISSLDDIDVKVLVNNVGSMGDIEPMFQTLDELPLEIANVQLDVNARFPVIFTKLLMPHLLKSQPALVLNIGSGVSELPTGYLQIYSGSKALQLAWSRAMHAEMLSEGHDIEFKTLITGGVATPRMEVKGRKPNFFEPSAADFAKSVLHVVGSSRTELWAHWTQALQFGIVLSLPLTTQRSFLSSYAKMFRNQSVKEGKTQ